MELAWSEATLFKTRPVQTADTTSIIYSTTPIVLHSLRWHRVFFYIKMDGSKNGRGMEVVFSVCFVCDLTDVSEFFFFPYFSFPQLFTSHLRTAVYPHICIYSTYLETSHSRKFNYSECRISRSVVDFVTAKIVTGSVNLIQTNPPHMFSLKYRHK